MADWLTPFFDPGSQSELLLLLLPELFELDEAASLSLGDPLADCCFKHASAPDSVSVDKEELCFFFLPLPLAFGRGALG